MVQVRVGLACGPRSVLRQAWLPRRSEASRPCWTDRGAVAGFLPPSLCCYSVCMVRMGDPHALLCRGPCLGLALVSSASAGVLLLLERAEHERKRRTGTK